MSPPSGAASGRPGGEHEATGQRAGAGHRHLLAEDRPHRQLEAVGGAGHPPAGLPWRTSGREQRVGAELLGDGDRVGVEVEQAPAAGDRGGQVAQVVEPQGGVHVVGRPARARPCRCRGAGASVRR